MGGCEMSDTPETDDLIPQFLAGGEIPDIFALARKLERERDETRKKLEDMQDQRDLAMKAIKRLEGEQDQTRERWRSAVIYWQRDVFKMQRERDEARAQLKAMQLEIEMNQRLREP
jgi:seryl-tRNA synthetase